MENEESKCYGFMYRESYYCMNPYGTCEFQEEREQHTFFGYGRLCLKGEKEKCKGASIVVEPDSRCEAGLLERVEEL